MPIGRPKKHRYPYDGYELLNPKVWLSEFARGRPKSIERMTSQEIAALEARVKRAKILKENEEKDRLREAITAMANANGFRVKDLISR